MCCCIAVARASLLVIFFPFTRLSVVDGIPERDPAACNLLDNIGLQDQAYSVVVFFLTSVNDSLEKLPRHVGRN